MVQCRLVVVALLLLLVLVVLGAPAQSRPSPATVDSGVVVRMWVGDVETRGRLLGSIRSGSDSVPYCRYPGPPCRAPVRPAQLGWFAPDELDHLDVQIGNRAWKGARIGGIIGVALGVAMGEMAYGFCDTGNCPSESQAIAAGILSGGLFGGGLGALIGSSFPRFERRF